MQAVFSIPLHISHLIVHISYCFDELSLLKLILRTPSLSDVVKSRPNYNIATRRMWPSSAVCQYSAADLKFDRSRLEQMGSTRNELKDMLVSNVKCCWIETRGGSFVLFDKDQAEDLLTAKLESIEKDILEVCQRVNEAADSLPQQ